MISLVLGHFFGGPGIPVKQDVGGILCTRFFLVDLAAAPWSPYEIDKSYPLFRWGNQGIGPGTWDLGPLGVADLSRFVDLESHHGEMRVEAATLGIS